MVTQELMLEEHLKHVQAFLQEMYAIMIDPIEDATGDVADTCRLLLNAARRDRDTINHLLHGEIPQTSPEGPGTFAGRNSEAAPTPPEGRMPPLAHEQNDSVDNGRVDSSTTEGKDCK